MDCIQREHRAGLTPRLDQWHFHSCWETKEVKDSNKTLTFFLRTIRPCTEDFTRHGYTIGIFFGSGYMNKTLNQYFPHTFYDDMLDVNIEVSG